LSKDFPEAITGGSEGGSIAKGIASAIRKAEEDYQKSLEQIYDDMTGVHLKNLRRKLPVTGKTFDWHVPKLV